MKATALLLGLAMAACSLAAQDTTLHLTRHLTQGEVDTYKMHMSATTQMGDVEMNATTKQTVTKIMPDGGAEVSVEFPSFKVLVGGNEMPVPVPPAKTMEVDKNGMPKTAGATGNDPSDFFRQNLPFYDRDWKPGDVANVDNTDAKTKQSTKGTIKFVGVDNGVAEFDSDLTIKTPAVEDPFNVKSKTYFDVATDMMETVEASMSQLPVQSGVVLTDVHFKLERVKS